MLYDTGKGIITVSGGKGSALDYIDLGINIVATGAIIAGLALGSPTIPIIVAGVVFI